MRVFNRNSNRTLAYVCETSTGPFVVPVRVMHKLASKRRNRGYYAYSRNGRSVTVRDKITGVLDVYHLAWVEITAI